MAGEIPDLHALARTGTGKGAARQARREGLVPGVVYSGSIDPLPVNIPYNMLFKKLKEGRFLSTLFNLQVDGQDDVRVICRSVQRDVVRDLPIHVDFMRLKRTSKINLFIAVDVVGQDNCPGIKQGGLLVMVSHEVELNVTASEIHESITIDVEGLEIGDTVTISSVVLPDGAKPTIDRDFVIANIAAPSGLAGAADEEEEGEEPEGEEADSEEAEEESGDEE